MATISYEYHRFEFNTPPLSPVTEEQYEKMRRDFENFFGDFIDEREAEFNKLKNPHAFKWKVFFILLAVALSFGFTGYFLEMSGHENVGFALDMIAVVAGLAIIIQPVQWIMSAGKSSGFGEYERKARAYYLWHRSIISGKDSYSDYLKVVSGKRMEDFQRFCAEEL
ncbi:MAG TPA: hypothetical protein VL651_17115 [Bacteroidia bacterium]|jgi:hypothetical protein|nr:hypothetical protein [Bacteroidia bacterium]